MRHITVEFFIADGVNNSALSGLIVEHRILGLRRKVIGALTVVYDGQKERWVYPADIEIETRDLLAQLETWAESHTFYTENVTLAAIKVGSTVTFGWRHTPTRSQQLCGYIRAAWRK